VGINRWSDIEERKRNETDAKAGEELAAENKGAPPPACRPPKGPRRTRRSARSSRSSRNVSPRAEESLPADRTFVSRALERRERR
jgi:hypothetical protein